MQRPGRWRGSMTVESAIVLPVFIVIVFTMIMLTKLVYIHALVQNALVQTVKEISTYSYIVKEVLRLDEIDRTVEEVLGGNIETTGFNESLGEFGDVVDGNVDAIFDIGDAVMDDPVGYGKNLVQGGLSATALGVYRDLLGEGTGLIASAIFPVYVGKSEAELDYLMRLLGVQEGLRGIRLKGRLNRGKSGALELTAAYRVEMDPPLSYFLNGKTMVQRAACVPWMGKES